MVRGCRSCFDACGHHPGGRSPKRFTVRQGQVWRAACDHHTAQLSRRFETCSMRLHAAAVRNAQRIRLDRDRRTGVRLPLIPFRSQRGSPIGLLTRIVPEVVQTDAVVFMKLDQFPVTSAQAGRGETLPGIRLSAGFINRQPTSCNLRPANQDRPPSQR